VDGPLICADEYHMADFRIKARRFATTGIPRVWPRIRASARPGESDWPAPIGWHAPRCM
jgi:hypothetical protein